MRITKIERKYIAFWGVVEAAALFPFYYAAWKLHQLTRKRKA